MKYLIIFMIFVLSSCSNNTQEVDKKIVSKNEEKIILTLWDSLTAWLWVEEKDNYPSKLEKKLKEKWLKYKVINGWVSWDTSENLKSRAELYTEPKPDILILVIWWNDGLRWLNLPPLKQNILDIIDIYDSLWTKIILWWMDVPSNLWENYKNNFKNLYVEISTERKDIYFLDFFLKWVAWIKELNNDDQIHPNSKWYDIIVNNLIEFMEKNKLLN